MVLNGSHLSGLQMMDYGSFKLSVLCGQDWSDVGMMMCMYQLWYIVSGN